MEPVFAKLSEIHPTHTLIVSRGSHHAYVEIPPAPGADYSFILYLEDDGEPQIGARLCSDETTGYFWHEPFELAGFKSVEDAQTDCLSALRKLLMHPTRIIHKHGWLFSSFRCEFYAYGEWFHHYSHSCFLPGGFKVPRTPGRRHIYSSPAVFASQVA